ncbi:acyl-coenzyme A thioesterase PaaI-like protein [Nocardia transvalensis]|uniref:Acyl-coenzyme A thioesterase PaaI-like protein n=1 Tax=Nocardia transvalensis TaxID=37333 RepID=A0A7W9PAV0_9NOCA|nr:hotdog domain-containing protein [Nocardia transvalensis]MBB5912550.1 acyl-coenzyme A thioesterase PaaI-like protein [Nocardia transvalensis]
MRLTRTGVYAAGHGVRFPVRDLAAGEHAVTHATATQFVRAAPGESWVRVRGELTRRGRTLAFVTATATLDDSPSTVIATSRITKSIIAGTGGLSG